MKNNKIISKLLDTNVKNNLMSLMLQIMVESRDVEVPTLSVKCTSTLDMHLWTCSSTLNKQSSAIFSFLNSYIFEVDVNGIAQGSYCFPL